MKLPEGEKLLDALGQCVIATDLTARVRYWNRAAERLFGWSAAEAKGRDLLEITVPPVTRLRARTAIVNRVLADQSWAGEFVVNHRDGRLFTVLCTASPVYDAKRRVVGLVGVAQDISDRKILEEELRQKANELATRDRLKDEFLSTLAHELRNPLAPILYAVETMRLREWDVEAVESAQRVAERQVRHMLRLIDDLMDVSRITRGVIELRTKPVDLSAVVTDAANASLPFLEARRHAFSIKLPERPIWLYADADRIEQVVTNLVNNAAKYTEAGGRIRLTVECDDPGAIIRVHDTGVGIPPDLLPRIFDLFTQGARSTDRTLGGLGIGLALARRLVELHGGTLEAHSEGVGRGSEFVVRFPRTIAAPEGDGPDTAPSSARMTVTRRRILVVEDNHDAAEALANLLRLRGHEALVTNDGKAALEAASRYRPDVILLDIGLPEMDGYQVARHLPHRFGHDRPVLVAMTGYAQEKDRVLAREAGFDYHLVKPVTLKTLEDLLWQLPAASRRTRERVITARFP